MKTFAQLGTEIGDLVTAKAEAYGHSFAKCSLYLRLLYPEGIRPSQYSDAMLLARDFDKSMRIANDAGAFGESPWDDKAGYALLGIYLHQELTGSPAGLPERGDLKEGTESCGNASGPDAASQPKEQPGSAAPSISERTTTSGREKIAIGPLPQPDGYSGTPESAPAPTATEKIANASEDDRRRPRPIGRNFDLWLTKMQGRNECGRCAECREKLPTAGRLERLLRTTVALHRIILCSSGGCDLKFHREVKKHNGRRDFCIVLYPLKKGAPR